MNFFCRLLGHTWVHKSDDPKIAWNTTKSMDELAMTASGVPRFYEECARCGAQRDLPVRVRPGSATPAAPGGDEPAPAGG